MTFRDTISLVKTVQQEFYKDLDNSNISDPSLIKLLFEETLVRILDNSRYY